MIKFTFLCFSLFCIGHQMTSQTFDSKLLSGHHWRMIGPHRGGRTVGAVGVPQQPHTFYIGVNNGGVWKTTDAGRTWFPIFDDQPTGSIGDVAVAPSNPNTLYVGSGEGLQRPDLSIGNGMYKSIDAGKNWTHLGLDSVQQIGGLAIDPLNENKVYVAALGRPYGANKERGVYRTVNGGKTWEQVLYIDENTGAVQVTIDPNNSQIVYADMWAGRLGPWENGMWNGKNSGLYKSMDGGNSWNKCTNGLPTTDQGLGRIGFCIAPSNSKILYATVDAGKQGGIYKSEDAGNSWNRIQSDERYWGRGSDFAEVKVDPHNENIIYSANVVTWKSTDGGKNFFAFRGAPGGDDYHRIWINPYNSDIILIASDQGAIITLNGGETFSSWYNQPTAQFYHVSADNAFPYNVYSGQQESGSVGIASRGNDGSINFRDWHPVGAEEYGYVVADPLDPNIIYGGKISKYDKRTGQTQNISPDAFRNGNYRFIRTAPIVFNPLDPKILYFAGNVVFKTRDGGHHWDVISPDLTREQWEVPKNVGIYASDDLKKMPRRGVIYTLAPSYIDTNILWCGTDDGLIHLTQNQGKTWTNVTPPQVTSWSKVSLMDASHFSKNTAYAAVNRIRCDDMKPHIYKTDDFGKNWKEIVNGLPNDPINVVKEDPKIKGLLFAGSERAVYVSFDDGEHWQSLRLNMPATSIRDLVIKDDDIVVATHGRSFWILDNITLLRQLKNIEIKSTNKAIHTLDILYKPQDSYRVRWNMNTDTPIPNEEPAGENPPEGAMIEYYLADNKSEVILEITDTYRNGIRKYSSRDSQLVITEGNVPPYWIRPQQILSNRAGAHRFLWDMHYDKITNPNSYPMAAIHKNTAPEPTSPWVMPKEYKAVLTVDGIRYEHNFEIKMDPRVSISKEDLDTQFILSSYCANERSRCQKIIENNIQIRQKLMATIKSLDSIEAKKLVILELQFKQFETTGTSNELDLNKLMNTFASLFHSLQACDCAPTEQQKIACESAVKNLHDLENVRWELMKKHLKELE